MADTTYCKIVDSDGRATYIETTDARSVPDGAQHFADVAARDADRDAYAEARRAADAAARHGS
jgi:hypothetical protein